MGHRVAGRSSRQFCPIQGYAPDRTTTRSTRRAPVGQQLEEVYQEHHRGTTQALIDAATTASSKAADPDWFPSSHPLNLPQSVRRAIARDFNPDAVFLNIPYSRRYTNLEVAMISTLTAYGLVPQMAKTRVGLEVRLHKIAALMLGCGYGVTDLTYVRRMNMPLELGVLLAWGKHTFVASARPYGTIKTISDLNFGDVHYHRQRVGELVRQLSRWIEQHCSRKRFSVSILMSRYRRLQRIRRSLGPDFEKLTPSEISKLLGIVEEEFSMKLVPSV